MSRQNKVRLSATNQAFESGKLNERNLQQKQNARLTCPFHSLRPLNLQRANAKAD
jgi:hypothetical protein